MVSAVVQTKRDIKRRSGVATSQKSRYRQKTQSTAVEIVAIMQTVRRHRDQITKVKKSKRGNGKGAR